MTLIIKLEVIMMMKSKYKLKIKLMLRMIDVLENISNIDVRISYSVG